MAAHRADRPWIGESTKSEDPFSLPDYVQDCTLCPGNKRVSGVLNPAYTQPFVFVNDHPPLGPEAPEPAGHTGFFKSSRAGGLAKVICFTPRHNTVLGRLSLDEASDVVRVWAEEYRSIGERPEVKCVHIFENRGQAVGVSNPHPHCQVYGTDFVFNIVQKESESLAQGFREHGACLFCLSLKAEKEEGRRIVAENHAFVAFVPFYARYPYEVFIAPKRHIPHVAAIAKEDRPLFARVLQTVLVKYDNLFKMPFPYVMALHQAPTDGEAHEEFHFHVEIHPPLRKPNLLKYLAGPEIGGGNMTNDSSPEQKAAELIAASEKHYAD